MARTKQVARKTKATKLRKQLKNQPNSSVNTPAVDKNQGTKKRHVHTLTHTLGQRKEGKEEIVPETRVHGVIEEKKLIELIADVLCLSHTKRKIEESDSQEFRAKVKESTTSMGVDCMFQFIQSVVCCLDETFNVKEDYWWSIEKRQEIHRAITEDGEIVNIEEVSADLKIIKDSCNGPSCKHLLSVPN